jgi:putative hydrolase of the HAD superfamily
MSLFSTEKCPLLIFDAGKVLADHDDEKFFSVMATHGCSRERIISSRDKYKLITGGNNGVTALPQFFAQAQDELGFQGDYTAFYQAWNCHFTPWPDMEELVIKLKETGYRMVVLSNTESGNWGYLKQNYSVLGRFDQLYTSYELGFAKPDPRIYQAVLDAENVPAANAIFTDDKPANVAGAEALGIKGILFHNRSQLEAELATLGVTVGLPKRTFSSLPNPTAQYFN